MTYVLITCASVLTASVLGTLLGFCFTKIPHKWNDIINGFAAGVMLAAAIIGLIMPAAEMTAAKGIWQVLLGIAVGVAVLNLIDKFTPHLHALPTSSEGEIVIHEEEHKTNGKTNSVLLFVLAIAIHNIPEGIAAGVGFGTNDVGNAFTVAGGIILQDIPDGLVLVAPLMMAGVSKKRTFLIALGIALLEVAGTFIGYFAASVSTALLPFLLSFAGGTMLYLVSDEMIPDTHSHGYERQATYALIIGFCVMLLLDVLL